MSGAGVYFYRNGNRYEGEFRNDKKNGVGIFYFANGNSYKGQFKDDKFDGRGVLTYQNGGYRYQGNFKRNMRDGCGIFYNFFNATKFERVYKAGKLISERKTSSEFSQDSSDAMSLTTSPRKAKNRMNIDTESDEKVEMKLLKESKKDFSSFPMKKDASFNEDAAIKKCRRNRYDHFVPLSKYEIPIRDIEIGKKISSGGLGKVYNAKWIGSGAGVAVVVKVIGLRKNLTKDDVLQEFKYHFELQSPLVVRVYGYSVMQKKVVIVMEKMEYNLHDYVHKKRLSLKKKLKLLKQMTQALHVLHSRNVIHRDVKMSNFLVSEDGRLKITDFGFSTKLKENTSKDYILSKAKGTFPFMPVELFNLPAKYSVFSDVYGLGCTMYETMFEKMPYGGFTIKELVVIKVNNQLPHFPTNLGVPKLIVEMIRDCFNYDPNSRPNTGELLEFLDDAENNVSAYNM